MIKIGFMDDLGLGTLFGSSATETATSSVSTVDTITIIVVVLGVLSVVGTVVWFFVAMKGFKHKFRVRHLTGSKEFIVDDRAKEIDVGGVPMWKLHKHKDLVPPPPADCVDISDKGIKVVEAWRISSGEYVYIETKTNVTEIKEAFDADNPEANRISMWQPFPSSQRTLLVRSLEKATIRKGKGWMDVVKEYAPYIMIIFFITVVFIFWEDIWKPATQVTSQIDSMLDSVATISEQQTEQQELMNEYLARIGKVEQTIPE